MMEAKWGLQNITDGMNFMNPHWNLCLVLHFWERECLEFWRSQNIYFEIEDYFSKMFVCVDECWLMPFTDLLDFYYFSCIFFNRYYYWILGVCYFFFKYPCVTLVFTVGVFYFNYRKKSTRKSTCIYIGRRRRRITLHLQQLSY